MIPGGGDLMKFCSLCVLGIGMIAAQPAFAQVSAYVDFSAAKFSSDFGPQEPGTHFLYGPRVGLSAAVAKLHGITLAGDVHGDFLGGSGLRYDGVAVGPKLSFRVKKFEPYADIAVGFARFNDGKNTKSSSTTDAELQFSGGIDHAIAKRFDWRIFEFGYTQYYANGGIYNPKSFNTGIVFHITQ
jgi:hypothetical protein